LSIIHLRYSRFAHTKYFCLSFYNPELFSLPLKHFIKGNRIEKEEHMQKKEKEKKKNQKQIKGFVH